MIEDYYAVVEGNLEMSRNEPSLIFDKRNPKCENDCAINLKNVVGKFDKRADRWENGVGSNLKNLSLSSWTRCDINTQVKWCEISK